jgi:hypothetical protein
VCPLLWLSVLLESLLSLILVLVVSQVILCNHLSSFSPNSGRQSWLHPEACFRLQDFTDSRHNHGPGINKVITPTFVPLRTKKWIDDRSLFFDESLFLHKSRDEISLSLEAFAYLEVWPLDHDGSVLLTVVTQALLLTIVCMFLSLFRFWWCRWRLSVECPGF